MAWGNSYEKAFQLIRRPLPHRLRTDGSDEEKGREKWSNYITISKDKTNKKSKEK